MPKLGCFGLLIIAVLIISLLVVGTLFFPVPRPHVALPADVVLHIGPIPVSNTLLASWLGILVLVAVFYTATRKMKLVPTGWQNVVEMPIEMLLNFAESVAGKENGRRFFPIVATIFLFVVVNAWLGLLPGFHTIGFGHVAEYQGAFAGSRTDFIVEAPLLRAANTDINMPLALALMSFVFVEYWGVSSIGFLRYGSKFIRVGQLLKGKVFMGLIDLFVGVLEAVSEFVRIVSFTFRLFGNMTAGEILVLMMAFLIPWVAALPFYGLEIIVGLVQALIFGGLTLVFATMATAHHGAEHE